MTNQLNKRNMWAIREQAAQCLAEGWNQKETAQRVGVTQNTMSSWMKDPEYLKHVANKALSEIREASPALHELLQKEVLLYDDYRVVEAFSVWAGCKQSANEIELDRQVVNYSKDRYCRLVNAAKEHCADSWSTAAGEFQARVEVERVPALAKAFLESLYEESFAVALRYRLPKGDTEQSGDQKNLDWIKGLQVESLRFEVCQLPDGAYWNIAFIDIDGEWAHVEIESQLESML